MSREPAPIERNSESSFAIAPLERNSESSWAGRSNRADRWSGSRGRIGWRRWRLARLRRRVRRAAPETARTSWRSRLVTPSPSSSTARCGKSRRAAATPATDLPSPELVFPLLMDPFAWRGRGVADLVALSGKKGNPLGTPTLGEADRVGGGKGRRSRLPSMSGVHGDGTIEAAREGEADLSYCTSRI